MAAGVVSRSAVHDAEPGGRGGAAAEQAAADAAPAEDAQPPLVDRQRPAGRTGTTRRPRPSIGVFARLRRRRSARRSTRRAGGGPQALRLRRAQRDHHASWAPPPACGCGTTSPTGPLELNAKSADLTRSAWAGAATRDFTDVDVAALDADAGPAAGLGGAGRSTCPPGRYETLLPPTAVADLMIYLYWSAARPGRADGRTVFSRPGGGTRVGERLAEPAAHAAQRPARSPAWSAPRSCWRTPPAGDVSVFDNGLPLGPHRVDLRRRAGRAAPDPALGRG